MSLRLTLAASAALAFASPAFAQEAPAQPAPPAAPAAPAQPSAEDMAVMAELEAAGEVMEVVMEEVEAQALVIRSDASLSDADKRARIEALVDARAPQMDAFFSVLERYLLMQAAQQGAGADEVEAAIPMIRTQIRAQVIAGLMGEQDAEGSPPAPGQ